MHFFSVEKTIPADPQILWSILTDSARLGRGDFGISRLEGRIAPGERIKLWSEAAPGRAFALRVGDFVAGKSMTWSGGMPLGLFRGVRRFTLTPGRDGTLFKMREDYSGAMLPVIWPSIPDLTGSFETFASALAATAMEQKR